MNVVIFFVVAASLFMSLYYVEYKYVLKEDYVYVNIDDREDIVKIVKKGFFMSTISSTDTLKKASTISLMTRYIPIEDLWN